MKNEPIRNIGFVCNEHAPKEGKYLGRAPKTFLNKFVKLAFKTDEGRKEHMWVKVHEVKGKELHGELDNDPVLEVGYKCGDWVAFEVHEIEDVCDED